MTSGKDRMRAPPRFSNARMLPALISSGSAAQGYSPRMLLSSGRLFGPGPRMSLITGKGAASIRLTKPGWNQVAAGVYRLGVGGLAGGGAEAQAVLAVQVNTGTAAGTQLQARATINDDGQNGKQHDAREGTKNDLLAVTVCAACNRKRGGHKGCE